MLKFKPEKPPVPSLSQSDLNLLEQLALAEARTDFWAFRQYMNPGMKMGWWQRQIAGELMMFWRDWQNGLRPILVIEAPPQHGKSYQVIDFIAWVSGQNPSLATIFASFSKRLGLRANLRLQRIMDSEKYQNLFPGTHLSRMKDKKKQRFARNSELLEFVGSGKGSFRNTTVGGSITGEGLDCLVAGTMIATNIGNVAIEELENAPSNVKVLGYKNGELSYEALSNFSRRPPSGIYRITTESGRILEATGNHQIFTQNRGYTETSVLSEGDVLLCSVQKEIYEAGVRCNEMAESKRQGSVLFERMLPKICRDRAPKEMRGLQPFHVQEDRKVLQPLPEDSQSKKARREISITKRKMPYVQQSFRSVASWKWKVCHLLWKEMRGARTFTNNVIKRKSYVEARRDSSEGATALSESLQYRKKAGFRTRWEKMRSLFFRSKASARSSHRQLADEQCIIKSCDALPVLSYRNTQPYEVGTGSDKVVRVEKVLGDAVTYDITVNNSHNFFANEILVHNCGIIDDPIKGREKANSETIREKTWDWFTDDFFTRFSDFAALLFILTRWHVDDPVGRLILQHPSVRVLKYPALAEEGIPLMPQDQRVPGSGEALFPEHKSQTFLLLRKAMLAMSSWMSLYQQMPFVLGGNIIKGGHFIRYTVPPKIKFRKIYADTAQKTKEHNDFSVFECWGYGEDKKIYLLDMIRGKWEAPELRQNAIDFWNKHKAVTGQGALREMKVEDKASGTGLIQDLKRGVMGNSAIPITGIERNVDKLTRVMDVLSYIEAGYVCLPAVSGFVSDFITECEAFTSDDGHAHDDQIDPMCDAIKDMLLSKARSMFDTD